MQANTFQCDLVQSGSICAELENFISLHQLRSINKITTHNNTTLHLILTVYLIIYLSKEISIY